jgi:hypothetical protein
VVYAWLLVESAFWPGSIEYVIWVCNLLLGFKMITGFIGIRRRI